jgi:hypothetical protein
MASGYSVAITVDDKFTAPLNRFNKQLAGLYAPVDRIQKSFAKMADVTGISRIERGFGAISRGAGDAAAALSRLSPALAAFGGIGSAAGIAAAMSRFGALGNQISYASRRAGATVSAFDALAGASRLMGGTAEGAQAGLTGFRDLLTNSAGGQSSAGLLYLRQFGIAFQGVGHTARDVMTVLPHALNALRSIGDPSLQHRVAEAWFGGSADEFIRLSKEGAAGLDQLMKRMERYGLWSKEAAAAGVRLNEAQTGLGFAVRGLGLSMATALEPEMTRILTGMDRWIVANRSWIAQRFGDEVKGVAGDMRAAAPGMSGFAKAVDDVAQSLGGWHRIIEVAGGITALSLSLRAIGFVARPFAAIGGRSAPAG